MLGACPGHRGSDSGRPSGMWGGVPVYSFDGSWRGAPDQGTHAGQIRVLAHEPKTAAGLRGVFQRSLANPEISPKVARRFAEIVEQLDGLLRELSGLLTVTYGVDGETREQKRRRLFG